MKPAPRFKVGDVVEFQYSECIPHEDLLIFDKELAIVTDVVLDLGYKQSIIVEWFNKDLDDDGHWYTTAFKLKTRCGDAQLSPVLSL
jgi:hypothetical protein